MQDAPASNVQRMYLEALLTESERLLQQAWHQAKDQTDLALGIDDFTLKKGTHVQHQYLRSLGRKSFHTWISECFTRDLEKSSPTAKSTGRSLTGKEQSSVRSLSAFSPLLREAYEWIESFSRWFDQSH